MRDYLARTGKDEREGVWGEENCGQERAVGAEGARCRCEEGRAHCAPSFLRFQGLGNIARRLKV